MKMEMLFIKQLIFRTDHQLSLKQVFSFARHSASQTLKCWDLQQRKDLFMRQPNKMGEQISNFPPWGAWTLDIYEISRVLRCGKRCSEVGKRWGHWSSMQAYLSYMLFHGMNVLIFGPVLSKGHPSDISTGPVLGSVVPTSLGQLSMNWTQLTSSSRKIPPANICLG